ncbi:hypothetical protein OZX73_04165 [Bifidobacterium sp. ESL0775]|uniref:hypothetical protein n=1 Tax=Bifidobacterium sp. ESL0775 TaxID=2983230 RepID=UPI0023F9E249|nr:hypothetical protein [Bifidobacterium sp. ESL0775]WEV68506.1 hypothetical protein OZX73_04165 [Bifidobacterium sp. ESL0775]
MKNFFKGISVSQIIAGALAAVTSFLLSAKIGIAGSVIGVAVGSIVSAVASQIYQNVLKESGKKLQEGTPNGEPEDEIAAGAGPDDRTRVIGSDVGHHGRLNNAPAVSSLVHGTSTLRLDGTSTSLAALAKNGGNKPGNDKPDATKAMPAVAGEGKNDKDSANRKDGKGAYQGATQVMSPAASGKTAVMPPVGGKPRATAVVGSNKLKGGPGQDDGHIHTFDSSRQKRYKRIAIVVAVVSALVAVGITAGIISLVTKGQGTDDVVRNIVTNSSTKNPKRRSDDSGDTSDKDKQGTNGTNQQNGSTTQNNSGTTGDSGTSNGTGSTSGGTGSSSGTSGNGGSGTTSGGTSGDSNGSGSGSTDTSHNGTGGTESGSGGDSSGTGTGAGAGESGSTSGGQTGGSSTGTNSSGSTGN